MPNRLYNFTIFPQSYNYGCWLACTYSLKKFDEFKTYIGLVAPVLLYDDHGIIFNESWLGGNRGLLLEASAIQAFNNANHLELATLDLQTYKVANQLDQGPVMIIGEITDVGFHCFIIYGIRGEDVYVADPMPVGRGHTFKTTFAALKDSHPRAFQYMLWNSS